LLLSIRTGLLPVGAGLSLLKAGLVILLFATERAKN
jgi:hypothetical protein